MTFYLFTVSDNSEMKFITQSLHGQHISYLFGLLEEPNENQKFALDQVGGGQIFGQGAAMSSDRPRTHSSRWVGEMPAAQQSAPCTAQTHLLLS